MSKEEKKFNRMDAPVFQFEVESDRERLARKGKESPFLPIGMAGFVGVLAYGAYAYKNRGKMSTSLYLIQLRVAAQGTVIACILGGLVYNVAKDFMSKGNDKKN